MEDTQLVMRVVTDHLMDHANAWYAQACRQTVERNDWEAAKSAKVAAVLVQLSRDLEEKVAS